MHDDYNYLYNMDEANILTTVASQLEAIGMMNGIATIFIEHPWITPILVSS